MGREGNRGSKGDKYLGYTLQRNGRQEAHVRDRIRKAAIMGQVWWIDKRRLEKIGKEGFGCSIS